MRAHHKPIASSSGLTVVELLVASTILVVVLAVGSTFLTEQLRMQRLVQARSQVQDLVRVIMNLVTQDLALAGTNFVAGIEGDAVDHASSEAGASLMAARVGVLCGSRGCLAIVESDAPEEPTIKMAVTYLSSQVLDPSEICRDIEYEYWSDDMTLTRSDAECGSVAIPAPLGDGIGPFQVGVKCSLATVLSNYEWGDCGEGSFGYARSAMVTIAARAPVRGARSADCDDDFVCYQLTQEVLMPNLKDR